MNRGFATIRQKKPMIVRNGKLKERLRNSLINLNREWIDTKNIQASKKKFNCIDLFSGAGGISCGFHMAGLESIFAVEINDVACETYKKNFPKAHVHCGNIEELAHERVKNAIADKIIHIMTGGFPCQGFSVAGFRDPDDKRNVLYKEVVRLVTELKPWYVVLENVPGITTMKGGEVIKTIIKDFKDIGYPNMSLEILEAADYGVAQLRPRAIFIANRFGMKNPYPRPQLKPDEYVPIEDAIKDLENHTRDPSINHEWTKHSAEFEKRISKVKPGCSLYEKYLDAYKRQYLGLPSMTVKENHGGTHIHYKLNRTLSARELARLQSFPDSFIFAGTMKKAMWQIGNAVPPVMFKNIGLALRPKLEEIENMIIS
ncbi:MAG: DNA cytosine methyltransferase [Nanoarchaeota archaeon]|nr:DNA cytosine methyltransferase [Nanoarchaeota archaeon]